MALRAFVAAAALVGGASAGYSDGNYDEPECWIDMKLQADCGVLGDVSPQWDPLLPLEWTVGKSPARYAATPRRARPGSSRGGGVSWGEAVIPPRRSRGARGAR